MEIPHDIGCYSLREAARLTELDSRRVRYLFQGTRNVPPVFAPHRPKVQGVIALTFLDLIELKIAGEIRKATRCSSQILRRRYQKLKTRFETDHPFAHQQIFTFGSSLIVEVFEEDEQELVDVDTGNRVIKGIVLPFLRRLDYDRRSLVARRWRIADGVMLDPTIHFGAPTLEREGVNTRIIANAYHANGQDAKVAAWWMGVSEESVRQAVAFEARYFKSAA